MQPMKTTIANIDLNLAERLAAFRTGVHFVEPLGIVNVLAEEAVEAAATAPTRPLLLLLLLLLLSNVPTM